MNSTFITCGCTGKLQTTFTLMQFKGIVFHWWNTLGKIVSPNKPLQLTWEKILTHFKRKFCSAEKMLELEKQFLALMKGSMSVDEYTNAFTDKMEFALRLVPDELPKIDQHVKGFPWEYIVSVNQAPTFETAVWAAKTVEGMIKKRATDSTEVSEKMKAGGSNNNSNKKKKNFSK